MSDTFGFRGSPAAKIEPGQATGLLALDTTRPKGKTASEVVRSTAQPFDPAYKKLPQGLLGAIIEGAWASAPRPVEPFAMAAGIGTFAGLVQRSYNINGQGLNQYIIAVGHTGVGKDLIQSYPDKVFEAIRTTVPAVDDFRGPGEIVSAQGMARALDRSKTKSMLCTVGELAMLAAEMAKPNASLNMNYIQRFLLQVYTKSGRKERLGEQAYSDSQKTIPVIQSPALTIMGEGIAEVFIAQLDRLMNGGLIPRFMVFEYAGEQVPLNHACNGFQLDAGLVNRLADIAGVSLTYAHNGNVYDVEQLPAALTILKDFEEHARTSLNGAATESARHAWNRAHLKALKLSALCAVGINHLQPVIDHESAQWATDLINAQTLNIIGKFANGEVGEVGGNQSKQHIEVKRVIREYIMEGFERFAKYGVHAEMHERMVVPDGYIQRRLITLPTFVNDKVGASKAIKAVIKDFLEQDELREVPKAQMQQLFGCGPRAYVVARPGPFLGV